MSLRDPCQRPLLSTEAAEPLHLAHNVQQLLVHGTFVLLEHCAVIGEAVIGAARIVMSQD